MRGKYQLRPLPHPPPPAEPSPDRSPEKNMEQQTEAVVSAGSSEKSGGEDMSLKEKEARLLRKLDLRVVPIITIMYTCAFLDRINIGNAVIFGLEKDLKMTGNDYSNALSIFFVAYIIFEVCNRSVMIAICC